MLLQMTDSALVCETGLWHELPPNVDGVHQAVRSSRWPTHIMQSNFAMGDGRPEFIMGVYDPLTEKFSNATSSAPVLLGNFAFFQSIAAVA